MPVDQCLSFPTQGPSGHHPGPAELGPDGDTSLDAPPADPPPPPLVLQFNCCSTNCMHYYLFSVTLDVSNYT